MSSNSGTIVIAILCSVILTTGIIMTVPQVQNTLRGPQGEPGIQGEQGIQGVKGDTGDKGPPGSDANCEFLESQLSIIQYQYDELQQDARAH